MQNLTFVILRNQFLKRHIFSPCAHSCRSSAPEAAGSCGHRRDARLEIQCKTKRCFPWPHQLVAKPMGLPRAYHCPSCPI